MKLIWLRKYIIFQDGGVAIVTEIKYSVKGIIYQVDYKNIYLFLL